MCTCLPPQGLPCWLSPVQDSAGAAYACSSVFGANLLSANSSSCTAPDPAVVAAAAALQAAAEQACSKLQLVHVLLSPVPASGNFFQAQNICLGPNSFQVLYMYVAGVLLLVLPLTCGYCLEHCAKSCWLSSTAMTAAKPPWLLTLPIFATQPCSSSWRGLGDTATASPAGAPKASGYQWHWMGPMAALLLVHLPWVGAELSVSYMGGVCAPALAGPAYAWMQGLF